jgi:SAM-dependent methyltransferase
MNEATVQLLNALNARFYSAHAHEFDQARAHPWAGFTRVLGHVSAHLPSVLDVGCGNGRLLPVLRARFDAGLCYTGVDASEPLLALARQRPIGADARFVHGDFVHTEPLQVLPAGAYDLVSVFAVLHHIPEERRRLALLRAAAARLAKGGVLAFTLWRFDTDPRFASRCVPPSQAQLGVGHTLRDDDLDVGDHLLRWGKGESALRYCHFVDEAELGRLLAGLGLTLIERFRADGAGDALNEYLILRG